MLGNSSNEIEQKTDDDLSVSDANFPRFFSRYQSALKRFIANLVLDPQDIDDICQESFLRAYKSHHQTVIKKPKSFLFTIAKNLVISDHRRISSKLTDYVEDIEVIESHTLATGLEYSDLEHGALAHEKLAIIFQSIEALPPKCRQAVIMRKVYGMETKVIAKRMNISVITASNYISRGMCEYAEAVEAYNEGTANVTATSLAHTKRRRT